MPRELPEFNLDPESQERAEKLTGIYQQKLGRLVEGGGPARSYAETREWRGRTREVAGDAPLRDVEATVEDFGAEVQNANRWAIGMPGVHIEGVGFAPFISPSPTDADARQFFSGPRDYEEWRTRVASRAWDEETPIEVVPPARAVEGFLGGLRSFLAFRLAGFKFWGQVAGAGAGSAGGGRGPFAPSGGLQVTLSCMNPGLRAMASPAYVVRWQQFGMPTTPVQGVLPPGLWLFAADGGIFGSSVVVDKIPAKIPPNFTPCTTAF